MTTTARTTPSGVPLEDGFSTKIAFAADPNIDFWEMSVQPPGLDIGEKIETTSMLNDTWRTFAAQVLKTLTDSNLTVKYDPAVYDQIIALQGVNGWITLHFPNGDTLDFVGYLQSFTPQTNEIGQLPTAAIKINPTNQLLGVETAPDYTAAV